ncbi:uncharacterized protein ACN2A1_014365 [Glossina fuscipes fuscipes]
MSNELLKDIIKTREVLKAKLRNIKLNQIVKVNLLEDTFQPITKPLKWIIKKLDNKNSSPLTSSFTNGSVENHNNGGDEGDDDDDVNNIDYNDVEAEADNDVAMGNNDVEIPTYNSLLLTKGSGLSLKSLDTRKPIYTYWDDPNELVDRLRLLLSSESVGHNNQKNEIISIIEELREANIII